MKNQSASNSSGVSRVWRWLLSIACLGLAGWVVQLRHEIDDLKTAATDAEARAKDAVQAAKAANADAKRWQAVAASDVAPAGNEPEPALASDDAATQAESKRRVDAQAAAALMNNPAMRDIINSQQAVLTQVTYKDLMDRFNLKPEERDYFQKLLIKKQTDLVNLGMSMMNPALSPQDRMAIVQQLRESQTTGVAQIQEFLNDDADFAAYQAYQQQETERREVGLFESAVAQSEPLDTAKADALAATMADERKNYPFTVDFYNDTSLGQPQNLNAATVNKFFEEQAGFENQVAAKAAEILSPTQLQAFRQNQAASRAMLRSKLNFVVQSASGGQ
jgi:hypothetical protein